MVYSFPIVVAVAGLAGRKVTLSHLNPHYRHDRKVAGHKIHVRLVRYIPSTSSNHSTLCRDFPKQKEGVAKALDNVWTAAGITLMIGMIVEGTLSWPSIIGLFTAGAACLYGAVRLRKGA